MPEYLHPGVYVEEMNDRPSSIVGVPTSTTAFLGVTERGAVGPRLVTGFEDFRHWFGEALDGNRYLPDAVRGFFENGGKRLFVARVVGVAAVRAEASFGGWILRAAGAGAWANRIWARIDHSTSVKIDASGNPAPVGIRVRLAYWSDGSPSFQPFDAFADATASPRPTLVEDFDDLLADESSPNHFATRLSVDSALCLLVRGAAGATDSLPACGSQVLIHGSDGLELPDAAAFKGDFAPGAPRDERMGLAALASNDFDEVSLVYAPGAAVDVQRALIAHCEQLRYRFAVIDSEPGTSSATLSDSRTKFGDTSYAALYYPWIVVEDPLSGATKTVPPGGHVLGVYARTDVERGVFKAPANEALIGVRRIEFETTDHEQSGLTARGVNVIRAFPGRGILVWGACTMASDGEWKYVNVRRLAIYLEQSIAKGLDWVVFEPNCRALWTRVTGMIQNFLHAQWRSGAIMGRSDREAYYVKCDRETMTQDDIDQGRLVCQIGVAMVRPAEFVVFRIFQQAAKDCCPP